MNRTLNLRTWREYRDWKREVIRRASGKCERCGSQRDLQAHHIEHLADLIEKHNITSAHKAVRCLALWDVNNGAAVCARCHAQIHADAATEEIFKKRLQCK